MLLFRCGTAALAMLTMSAVAMPAPYDLLDARNPAHCTTTYASTACTPTTFQHRSTVTVSCKETHTMHQTVTVTPRPSTVTALPGLTTVRTTASAATPTVTQTVPETDTITLSTVTVPTQVTQTESETATTTPTSTISPGTAFLPVQTSLPGATNTFQNAKRDAYQARMEARALLGSSTSKVVSTSKPRYPKRINCFAVATVTKTAVATVTGATKTVTGSASTVTLPNSKTITITSTVVPPTASAVTVTSTLTQFTTESPTVTQTTTQTVTNTQTVTAPTFTDYVQCRPNNFASVYNNAAILNFQWTTNADASGQGNNIISASSARDCCIQCVDNDCAVGMYFPGGTCWLETHTNCNAYNQYSVTVNWRSPDQPNLMMFNGNCGTIFVAQPYSS